jgi:hypothetical protein
MMMVDGEAARALGTLARERWRLATGRQIKPARPGPDSWPPDVEPQVTDAMVAISRTLPPRNSHQPVRAIRDFRNRFLAEHLGVAEERVATEIDAQGSMSATIDRLGSPQRTLKRLENFGVSETVVSLARIADPEQPITMENLVAQFAPARKFVCAACDG